MTVLTFEAPRFSCSLACGQCDFVKANGTRCRNRVCFGTPTCWIHTMIQYGVKTRLSTIPNAGKGLFATRDFRFREYICPYVGEELPEDCITLRYGEGTAPYATSSGDDSIDSACQRGIASLANGLFTPGGRSRDKRFHNAELYHNEGDNDRPWLKALRGIRSGQEIFVYYGRDYVLGNDHTTRRRRTVDNRPC